MSVLNQRKTAERILRGDMPEGNLNTVDGLIIVRDETIQIYMNLLSELLFSTIDENSTDEMAKGRIELFDTVMAAINIRRIGRLHKLIEELNIALTNFHQDMSLWTSSKMKNNILTFITDFWIWSPQQRNSLLVIEELQPVQEAELQEKKTPAAKATKPAASTKSATATKKASKPRTKAAPKTTK